MWQQLSPILSHGDASILKVQHWLQSNPRRERCFADDHGRTGRAGRADLSAPAPPATGLKPTEYCQHLRVGKAREMLEFTNGTIDHIAWTVGYQDPERVSRDIQKDYRVGTE